MSETKDLYAILGVLPDAEAEVIRAVYLALAKKYHPDSSGSSDHVEKLKDINEAYETLSDPDKRKEYDAARPKQDDGTGDYEPDVDDEDLTVDDYKDDWAFAVEYQPELARLLKEVAAISPTLSIVFQSTILSNKAFKEANNIKDRLISAFLIRYFGKSKSIQNFASSLLREKQMAAANELNRAIKIFGENINDRELISKIKGKHALFDDKWETGLKLIEEYKGYKIYQREDNQFIVCSEPNIKAIGSKHYPSKSAARYFVEHFQSAGN